MSPPRFDPPPVHPMIMSGFLGGGEGNCRNVYRVVALMQLAIAMLVLVTLNKWKICENDTSSETEEVKEVPEKERCRYQHFIARILLRRRVPYRDMGRYICN